MYILTTLQYSTIMYTKKLTSKQPLLKESLYMCYESNTSYGCVHHWNECEFLSELLILVRRKT